MKNLIFLSLLFSLNIYSNFNSFRPIDPREMFEEYDWSEKDFDTDFKKKCTRFLKLLKTCLNQGDLDRNEVNLKMYDICIALVDEQLKKENQIRQMKNFEEKNL